MKQKKTIQASLRISEEVNSYIWRMGKKTFSANFDALVIFCMKREKLIYDQVQALEERKEQLNQEIQDKEDLLSDLDRLRICIKQIMQKG